jgi:UDP-N-acetylmuramate--alanine ligase
MTGLFSGIRKFHFIGIGGIGMSALSRLLISRNIQVSGSDIEENPQTQVLSHLGAKVQIGHKRKNLGDAEVVVYSSAIPPDNPELDEAAKRKLTIIHRSELLSEMMRFRHGITVSGTHGKTTTSALITQIMIDGGLDPEAALGADFKGINGNAWPGKGNYFIAEADESDRSFLRLNPIWTVVTNIDSDHLDEYQDISDLLETFTTHMNSIPFFGAIIACADDPNLRSVLRNVHRPVLTYGLADGCDFSARNIRPEGLNTRYSLYRGKHYTGEVKLGLAGEHNVLNSIAAAALGIHLGIPFSSVAESLESFAGVERRLEWKGERNGVWIFDDYGHHPSEIRATLKALRSLKKRLVVVFQPHRYTRTQHLIDELADCFSDADELCLMDIYSAGEKPIEGVSSIELAQKISQTRTIQYSGSEEDTVSFLNQNVRSGDIVLTLGAGDVWKTGEKFLNNGG